MPWNIEHAVRLLSPTTSDWSVRDCAGQICTSYLLTPVFEWLDTSLASGGTVWYMRNASICFKAVDKLSNSLNRRWKISNREVPYIQCGMSPESLSGLCAIPSHTCEWPDCPNSEIEEIDILKGYDEITGEEAGRPILCIRLRIDKIAWEGTLGEN